ncbi:MAG: MmcQ/YjbR family DNA-binding protein, partial [Tepidiformaceae bacterium]
EDIEAAVAQVMSLGGSAAPPVENGNGWASACRDNQGGEFSLWQPSAEYALPPDADALEARMREICMALPEVTEKGGGRAAWQVRGKSFLMFMDKHHGDGRVGIWAKSTHETQDMLVRGAPETFYVPPYMGPSGWVGMRLDRAETDWETAANLARDGYRMAAPKRFAALV